jgi:hypothetical protein
VYFKVVNKNENLSFQDFLIERFLNEKSKEKKLTIDNPFSPEKKEDILSSIISPEPKLEEKISEPLPSLHEEAIESPEEKIQETTEINEEIQNTEIKEEGKIPDWLKTMTSQEGISEAVEVPAIEEKEEIPEIEEEIKSEEIPEIVEEKQEETIEENKEDITDEIKQEEEMYDWLK